jgi:hypothetical protein
MPRGEGLDASGSLLFRFRRYSQDLVALTRNAVGNRAELVFVCHTDTVPFEES